MTKKDDEMGFTISSDSPLTIKGEDYWSVIPLTKDNTQVPLWPLEFYNVYDVLRMGAKKYEPDGWLQPNGKRTTFKEYHDSMFHHIAKSYAAGRNGNGRLDEESQLDHLLHAAVNCLMCYTRIKRNIINDND